MMKKNTWKIGCFILIGLSLVGCKKVPYFEEEKKSIEAISEKNQYIDEKVSAIFSAEDFVPFFKSYFSFTDEELSKLNEISPKIDVKYWENLDKNYEPLIMDKLQSFLADEVKQALKKGYLQADLNMPKWMKINEYIVSGQAKVEHVEIESTRDLEDEIIYEIATETTNNCYPLETFNEQYRWSNECGYWEKRLEGEKEEIEPVNLQIPLSTSYIYSKAQDKMRLKQLFWISVKKKPTLEIMKIECAQLYKGNVNRQNHFLETQHALRIPFQKEPTLKEKECMSKIIHMLFSMKQDDETYYRKCYETSLAAFANVWHDYSLDDEVIVKDDYQEAFSKNLIPYQEGVWKFEIDEQEIDYESSVYSTQNQPRFIVTVRAKALLNNEQIVYYKYQYFVCLEKNKIEAIQLINVEEALNTNEYTIN